VQHGAADREPLHHPAAEQAHRLVGAAVHRDRVQHLLDALPSDAMQARVVAKVLAVVEVAVQQRLLR
jgi:hypothetical protein